MQNLRITGIEEEDNESEGAVCNKVCKVAEAVGAPIRQDDISCVRVGKSPAAGAKPRHTIVQFALRKKRDAVYNARFALKDKTNFRGVYINEDLTPKRPTACCPHEGKESTKCEGSNDEAWEDHLQNER